MSRDGLLVVPLPLPLRKHSSKSRQRIEFGSGSNGKSKPCVSVEEIRGQREIGRGEVVAQRLGGIQSHTTWECWFEPVWSFQYLCHTFG